MEEWDVCLSERLQSDVRARIIGCNNAQMERIDLSFALHLGEHLYCHTDNLSKDLQGTKMAAVSGQRLANLTKGTLTKIRIDQSFDHFYANVARKSEGLLGEPCFQENDALRPDWRLVLVHQAILKPLKIPLDGSVTRLLILSSRLSISALIRKASAAKPRWRPSWLNLLMVTTMRQSSVS